MYDNEFKRNIIKDIWKFMTNRLLIMSIIITGIFYMMTVKLFDLQIVNGEAYVKDLKVGDMKEIEIPAPRGTIYDRYGRPLAVNRTAFSVKIDPSVSAKNTNEMLYALVKLFEKHNQQYIDDFPISRDEPFAFEFGGSESREKWWKENMDVPLDSTAKDAFLYLCDYFEVDPEMSPTEARKLLALRSSLYMQRFEKYNIITIAYNVNQQAVVELEERGREFPGVFVDTESLREYPANKYMSHIVGYIGKISESDLEMNEDKGYSPTDLFGKTGIERSFEDDLRGQKGSNIVEVGSLGKRLRTVEVEHPVPGNKIYLTVDSKLQEKTYNHLEDTLREVLMNKLQGKSAKEEPISLQQLFSSMINSNNISIKKILDSQPGSESFKLREYIFSNDFAVTIAPKDEKARQANTEKIKAILADGIKDNKITPVQMLIVMIEQGIITGDDEYILRLRKGQITALSAVLGKMQTYEITPQMTNLDPSTGSVVVLDVNTGSTLAAVTYPTYDNNELVNNVNNDYYAKISNDPTSPITNRPFMEPRAPGSTFKMISAIAGLETGIINPRTTIYDETTFTKAGKPYTSCWSRSYSHGAINVEHALEVSCNYFFCEMAYRMGNMKLGNESVSIDALNKYMMEFGLNQRSGVEIGERADALIASMVRREWPENTPIISSPLFKEYSMKFYNPDVSKTDYMWRDGDTVKTSIGQANNEYTAASMAKYIATLASGGKRYQLHLLDKITTQQDELVHKFEPIVETEVQISQQTYDSVMNGMLLVTEGYNGTAKEIFRDFPIRVAAKTGTAEEKKNRPDHASFAAIVPYENPQIVVYVSMPFGTSRTTAAPAAQLAKKVISEYMGLENEPERAPLENSLAE